MRVRCIERVVAAVLPESKGRNHGAPLSLAVHTLHPNPAVLDYLRKPSVRYPFLCNPSSFTPPLAEVRFALRFLYVVEATLPHP